MGKPENHVEKYLLDRAKEENFICYKFVSPGNNGVPDRIVLGNNLTVFIETKAENEKPRPIQKKTINDMIDKGAFVYVIDNRDDIDKILRCIKRGKMPKPKKLRLEKILL